MAAKCSQSWTRGRRENKTRRFRMPKMEKYKHLEMFGVAQQETMPIAQAKTIATDKETGKKGKGRTRSGGSGLCVYFCNFCICLFFRAEIFLASWTAGYGFLRFALAYYLFID